MVRRGAENSRTKDFYDVYVLARDFAFDGRRLGAAIAATFAARKTAIDTALPVALTARFFDEEQRSRAWDGYVRKNTLPADGVTFAIVGELLLAFLVPVWRALAEPRAHTDMWPPRGPWGPSPTEAPP
jgi:hypothetical protein